MPGTAPSPERSDSSHAPVMLAEVTAALAPRDGGTYVDATFGGGGYTRAILRHAACTVWGIDRDPEAITLGEALVREFAGRLTLVQGRFGDMEGLLKPRGVAMVDGVAFDLGVSSLHLDRPERGFSFRLDAPLDMRMETSGPSAADLVNSATESELAEIVRSYGQERRARAVARAIVAARRRAPIRRTGELAGIVRSVVRRSRDGIDPATRTFQALRMHVNDELGELDRGLAAAERLLRPRGRLAAVSFHSLEDGRVKRFLRARGGGAPRPSRHAPAVSTATKSPEPSFTLLHRRAIKPKSAEIAANPRARSARLRAAERTAAAAWPAQEAP